MVSAKAHSLDIESFAKEQLEGKNVESILEQIKQKDSDERLKIEEKVWETRLQDASAKIEELEKENLNQREELTSKLEQEMVHFHLPIYRILRFSKIGDFFNLSISRIRSFAVLIYSSIFTLFQRYRSRKIQNQ